MEVLLIIGAATVFGGLILRAVRTPAPPRKLKSGPPAVEPLPRIAYLPTWEYCGRASGECPVPPGSHPWKDKRWSCAKCGMDASAKVDEYDELLVSRETFKPAADGWLVSSRLPDGRHAPAIDIDFAARLDWTGRSWELTLERAVTPEKILFVLRVLRECGLVAYESHRRQEKELLRPSEGVPSGRAPDGYPGWTFDLAVPARLVPSQTEGHFHLYLEKEVGWMDYERLLRAMTEAGFVERGFYAMTLRRGMSMLRKMD
jgi:hypothetical protein